MRVLGEARALGAVQLAETHRLGYYTNLITSGAGLNERRLAALRNAGLDQIQPSFQASSQELNDYLSRTRTFDLKRRLAAQIKAHRFPMVMNCVVHRLKHRQVGQIIDLAVEIGAEYLEFANVQFYGWAYQNRQQLMPTRAQLKRAEAPKRCMNGWGSTFVCISPEGTALPCQADTPGD